MNSIHLSQQPAGVLPATHPFTGGVTVVLLVFCLSLVPAVRTVNAAATVTVLAPFQFNNALGQFPQGALALGADGNFYGVTTTGAANNHGAVFKVSTAGSLSKIVDFDGTVNYPFGPVFGPDGNLYGVADVSSTAFKVTLSGSGNTLSFFTASSSPHASLVVGSDGNFYGTTEESGTGAVGTTFRMTTGGQITRLASFPGPFVTPAIGAYPDTALVEGSPGVFYGTTINGANGHGTIYVATSGGSLSLLHTFTATDVNGYSGKNSDGTDPNELVKGRDGNLYGTAQHGGAFGFGTVFKITPSGLFTTLFSFDGTQYGQPSAGLVEGNDGNFYGTTASVGVGVGVVFKITPSGTLTVLAPLNGGIVGPSKLVQGSDGKFYGTSYAAGGDNAGTVFVVDAGLPPLQNGTPSITTQPSNQTVIAGQTASFTVTATGAAPLSYQWRKGGVNVTGATSASLTLDNVQTNQAGSYTVVIANAYGSVTSSVAVLSVTTLQSTPTITSPTPGSTLTSTNVTFQWSGISGASDYFLYVGKTVGTNDIFAQDQALNLSTTVTGLPQNGTILYVRLYWQIASVWYYTDYTYTATFAQQQQMATISVQANPLSAGTTHGGGTYPVGSSQQISVTAINPWVFTSWGDLNTNATRTVIVPAGGATYTANFSPISMLPDLTKGTDSLNNLNPQTGAVVTASVTVQNQSCSGFNAAAGAFHVGFYWSANTNFTGVSAFHETPVNGCAPGGTVTINQNIQISTTTTPGIYYLGYKIDDSNEVAECSESNNGIYYWTLTVGVPSPMATIAVLANPLTGGYVSGGGTYAVGSTPQISATASNGWVFTSWNDGNTQNPRSITVPPNGATYTATFAQQQQMATISVQPNPSNAGTVSGGGTYPVGSSQQISVTAINPWVFSSWNDLNTNATRTIIVPAGGATYLASFNWAGLWDSLKLTETYQDKIGCNLDNTCDTYPTGAFTVSAVLFTWAGLDAATLNGDTPVYINIGNWFYNGTALSDDPLYTAGAKKAKLPLTYQDSNGQTKSAGTATLIFGKNSTLLTISSKAGTDAQNKTIQDFLDADTLMGNATPGHPIAVSDTVTALIMIGDYSEPFTIDITGTDAAKNGKAKDGSLQLLDTIKIKGVSR